MKFKSALSPVAILVVAFSVIADLSCQPSASQDDSASGGDGGDGGGGQGGAPVAGVDGNEGGAGSAGSAGGGGSAGSGGGAPGIAGGAGGQAPGGVGGKVMTTDFCNPANHRPFARDGFLDAVKDRVQQGTDFARGVDATIAKGEIVSVPFAGGSVSVYVPSAYAKAEDGKVALMIFISGDGSGYKDDITYRIVDNLIKAGELPVMLLAFLPTANKQEIEGNPQGWADGLATKMFPAVKAKFSKVSGAANMHGMAGGSSWGLGSFHAAWFKPDFMGKVLSHSGSFVCFGTLGDYPKAIRNNAKKPMRVAMTVGHCDIVGGQCATECKTTMGWCSTDASSCHANWGEINIAVAVAMKEKDYAFRLIRGFGGHAITFWTSMLADDLRWLWRPEVCP